MTWMICCENIQDVDLFEGCRQVQKDGSVRYIGGDRAEFYTPDRVNLIKPAYLAEVKDYISQIQYQLRVLTIGDGIEHARRRDMLGQSFTEVMRAFFRSGKIYSTPEAEQIKRQRSNPNGQ